MNIARWRVFAVIGLVLSVGPLSVQAENWPRFRGPTGQGVSSETGVPLHWSATENIAWKTAIPGEGWSSPVVFGDGEDDKLGFKKPWDGAVLLALDKQSGEVRWRGSRGLSRLAHVTPNVLRQDGKVQLVSAAGDAIQGHDAATGKLLWTVYSQGEGVAPSIVLGDGLVYTCSGFEAPTIRVVRPNGSGDVTKTHIAWEQIQGVPSLASLLLVDRWVYAVTDAGVLNCFDAQTGVPIWKHRIGGKHSASPILAEGRIYFLSEPDGEAIIIEAGPEYKELARNTLGELCKASLAVSQGNIFIRSEHNLFCIGDAPQ